MVCTTIKEEAMDKRIPETYIIIKRMHRRAIDGKYALEQSETSKTISKHIGIVLKEVIEWMEGAFTREELEGK